MIWGKFLGSSSLPALWLSKQQLRSKAFNSIDVLIDTGGQLRFTDRKHVMKGQIQDCLQTLESNRVRIYNHYSINVMFSVSWLDLWLPYWSQAECELANSAQIQATHLFSCTELDLTLKTDKTLSQALLQLVLVCVASCQLSLMEKPNAERLQPVPWHRAQKKGVSTGTILFRAAAC